MQAGWRLREVEGSRCGDHVDVAMVGGMDLGSGDRGNYDSGRNQFQGPEMETAAGSERSRFGCVKLERPGAIWYPLTCVSGREDRAE